MCAGQHNPVHLPHVVVVQAEGDDRQIPTLLSVSCQVSAQFSTCTIVGLNGTLVEAKMLTFTLECMHFIFIKCPI
jgi:hypothetical protein